MAISNRDRIAKGLETLRDGLAAFVKRELEAHYGEGWEKKAIDVSRVRLDLGDDGAAHWDNYALLKVMWELWNTIFGKQLGRTDRSLISELQDVRNEWAHEKPISSNDALRALDSMQRLLTSVGAPEQAAALDQSKNELMRTVFQEQSRQKRRTAGIEGNPTAGLKPWREVITPHKDVASGNYLQAEFACDLNQVLARTATPEYQEPVEFFRRTFLTQGLTDLLEIALRRLSGKGGEPVVDLQTNFGGGKTHSMLALYHLFSGIPSADLPGLEPLISSVGVEKAPEARRAVLVGTALSAGEVSKKNDGTSIHTLWGEMAWQLGGKAAYKMVKDSDEHGISPGSEVLTKLFNRFSPSIILIDEWVAYARQTVNKRGLPSGDFESQNTFAQAITEAAKAAEKTLVVASIPASKIEIGGEHGNYAVDMLQNVFKRVGAQWRPASAKEGFEIVRRRLFDPIRDKDLFAHRDAVVDAFSAMYHQHSGLFPGTCSEPDYRRNLEAAYPIHPEIFDRLYEDWSTLDKFQRTRGVLRLLAKVIHSLWESQDKNLLVMPSSVPVDDPSVKSELTRYLEDNWEPVISQDVDGEDSLPAKIDREVTTLGRYSASRRVARTLYLGTAPGAKGKNPGVDDRQVNLGCVQPGETVQTFGDALRRLTDKATYLYVDKNRYWYSTHPSVTRTAEDRAGRIDVDDLNEEITQRLRKEKARGDFCGIHVCPEGTGDVPDEPETRLVVISPKHPHRKGQTDSQARSAVEELLLNRANSPRINRNTLVFLVPDAQRLEELHDATRQYLAWSSIYNQREELNLDAFQTTQARTKAESANETVHLRIRETWVLVLVPRQTDPAGGVQWEEVKLSVADKPLAERTATKLVAEELLLPVFGSVRLKMELDKYLWKDRDHVSFAELAEYFPRYLYLPRIVGRETLERSVQDVVAQAVAGDLFAVAEAFDEASGKYLGLRLGGGGVFALMPSTLIVKADIAQRQTKPPDPPPDIDPPVLPPVKPDPTKPDPMVKQRPTRFFGSVRLDNQRLGSSAGKVVEEVVQHLATLPGAEVDVRLEIHVRVPGGIGESVVRTVTENCNTLKFDSKGFEGE
jgi:hypothetical protein